MNKRALSIFFFLFLLVIVFSYLNRVFSSANLNENGYRDFKKLAKEANIDILFFGSSHCYTSFNPLIVSKETKTISFNLGSPELNIALTDLVMEEALKYTKPKLIVVDVFEETLRELNSAESMGYQLTALDQIPNYSIAKIEKVFEIYEKKQLPSVLFPLIRNRSDWNTQNFASLSLRSPDFEFNYIYSDGFQGYFNVLKPDISKGYTSFNTRALMRDSNITFLSEKVKQHLRDIAAITKKNGADLLFVSSPDLRVPFRNYVFFDEMEDFCKSIGVSFVNMNNHYDELGLTLEDFMDIQHLNIDGATKASEFISNYINTNYHLAPRTNDESWQQLQNKYLKFKNAFLRCDSVSPTLISR